MPFLSKSIFGSGSGLSVNLDSFDPREQLSNVGANIPIPQLDKVQQAKDKLTNVQNQVSGIKSTLGSVPGKLQNLPNEIQNLGQQQLNEAFGEGGLSAFGGFGNPLDAFINGGSTYDDAILRAARNAQSGKSGANVAGSRISNELEQYANGTFIFTLGVLSTRAASFPDQTYKKTNLASGQILRSGGGLGASKALTAYEGSGRLEYFIDDIEIETIIAPTTKQRATNATSITFKVHEPYSMGLFLQSLQVASAAEFRNYLETPMLLTVEFVGQDDDGNMLSPVAKRHFPLKLVAMDMNVNGGGTVYDVEAVPYNEQAMTDSIQTMNTDIKLEGATLEEILDSGPTSLSNIINERYKSQLDTRQAARPDEMIIIFPNDPSSSKGSAGSADSVGSTIFDLTNSSNENTLKDFVSLGDLGIGLNTFGGSNSRFSDAQRDTIQNSVNSFNSTQASLVSKLRESLNGQSNKIGKSKLIPPSISAGGVHPFNEAQQPRNPDNDIWVNDVMGVSADRRSYMFAKDSKIQDIIEELILVSDYGRQFSEPKPDENGMVDWFKIETEVYPISDDAEQIRSGKVPKVYVYKVQPYKVHMASISGPTSTPPSIAQLKANAAKQYDYIYTGLNNDILDFEIELNNQFFAGVSADGDANSAGSVTRGSNGTGLQGEGQSQPSSNAGASGATGQTRTTGNHSTGHTAGGGGGDESVATRVARTFHDSIINSEADLLSINFTIMGDPYYLADSGMGNYNSRPGTLNVTQDGQMDYQRSEVDIVVNFRTPTDYNDETGLMDFPEDTTLVEAFSGVYKVLQVNNSWRGGKFTQELDCIRRKNQENTYTGNSALKTQNPAPSELDEAGRGSGSKAKVAEMAATGNTSVNPEAALAGGRDKLESTVKDVLGQADNAVKKAEAQVKGALSQAENAVKNAEAQAKGALSSVKDQVKNVFNDDQIGP